MNAQLPSIGSWYCIHGHDLFEVVAFDESDGTIETQYFDGTVEEMELADWEAQFSAGVIEAAEPPEDWSGSVDVEREDEPRSSDYHEDGRKSAMGAEGLDLFD